MTQIEAIQLYKRDFYRRFKKVISVNIEPRQYDDSDVTFLRMNTIVERILKTNGWNDSIFMRTRKREVVTARYMIFYVLWTLGYSYSHIARRFDYDHTTVMSARKKIQEQIEIYDEIEDLLNKILEEVKTFA